MFECFGLAYGFFLALFAHLLVAPFLTFSLRLLGRMSKWLILKILSNYFETSIEELISNKEKEPPSHSNESNELNELLEELRTRSEMKMLFSVTKNASKEDVETAVKVIEAMLEN